MVAFGREGEGTKSVRRTSVNRDGELQKIRGAKALLVEDNEINQQVDQGNTRNRPV